MPKNKDYSEDARNFFLNEQNKKKQKKLEEKFGMQKFEVNEDTPPEIMNSFLNNIEQFEEQYENAENKKIIEILGFPAFRKLDDIKPEEITQETDKILEKYGEFNMFIDIIEKDEVSEEDFYKFITEELPQHETYFMQIEGMNTNFIYEEFHPSNKLDAKDTIRYFKYALIDKNEDDIKMWLAKDGIYFNGVLKTQPQFTEEIFLLIRGLAAYCEINFKSFHFEEKNKVEAEFIIDYGSSEKMQKQEIFDFEFELVRSEFGGFEIKKCIIK